MEITLVENYGVKEKRKPSEAIVFEMNLEGQVGFYQAERETQGV